MKHKRLAAAVLAAALWLTGCGGAASPAAPAGSGAASQSAADTAVQTAQKDRITEQFTLEKTVRSEYGITQKLTIHVPQLVCDSPDAEYINNELAAMYAAEYRDYESYPQAEVSQDEWCPQILDGHTRYRILRKHPLIAYQIQEIELDNRYAALSWICQNQLGRRNLDPERKKFLMGKLYESEKLARGGSKERAHDENGRFTSMVQNDPLRAKQLSTCERIAAQNGVGAATVKRAEKYAKGVDAAEDAVPGAREEILTGRIKATDAEITALAKTPKAEIPAALAELRKPKQERQPRKAETSSSKQTLSEISKSIQGHQRQLTTEERTFLKASIDNRYQERAVANGSLMMCEVQGAKEDFIRRWNSIFKEYPDVFEDSDCRKTIHDLIEDTIQYLLTVKEKTL